MGYDFKRFQKDIDEFVVGVTRNRHVGEGGCIIIADESGNIVSDRNGNEGQNLDVTGILIDTDTGLSAEERDAGGLGIYIVKKSMDEIAYAYEDGKNILSIRKRI